MGQNSRRYRRRLQETVVNGVAINLLWLRPGQVGGSETYAVRLLQALGRDPNAPSIEIFASSATTQAHPFLETHFTVNQHNPALGRGGRVWLENRLFADNESAQLTHHLGGTIPKRQHDGQCVVTIYDIQYRDYPQNFSGIKRRYLDLAVQRTLNRADAVCVMSEFSAGSLEQHFGYPKEKCKIVPPAIEAVTTSKTQQSEKGGYLLYPAVTWAHKEHKFLIEVVEHIQDLELVFVGARGPLHDEVLRAMKGSPASDRIVHLGVVDQKELDVLYRRAFCTAFPSQYEGFGQPVIEAMARGCPVISSRGGALPETVGTGGITVPMDVDLWVDAVNVIRQSHERQKWVENGLRRAADFSNDRAAATQVGVYNELLDR